MKSFGWMVMSSLAVFVVGTSTSWAQEAAPPPLDCENDGSIGACMGELLDIQGDTIDEVEGMLTDMRAMNMFSFAREQLGLVAQGPGPEEDLFARIQTLRNEHARATATNEVTTDDEFDDMIAQADTEKGKKCKLTDKPFFDSLEGDLASLGLESAGPKLGNGKCDIFNAVDLAGNAVKVHEKKENMCEKVCEEKPNQQGKSKERFVGGLLDAISTARGAEQRLSAQRARVSELGLLLAEFRLSTADSQLSTATAGPSDPCDPGTPGPGADLIAIQVLNGLITALDGVITGLDAAIVVGNIITEVLKTVADIADKPCKQTVAGFNASAACIPFTVAFHVSKGIVGVIGGLKSILGDAKSLLGDAKNIIVTAVKIDNASKADKGKACSKETRDEFKPGGQCVALLCKGGPDDNKACVNDGDCSDGAIFILQADVADLIRAAGETSAELAVIKAELALMKSLLEENRDLLLTPHGRREGFRP